MTTRTAPSPEAVIEAARIERGMNKSELARRIGMPRASLSKALHGHAFYRLTDERLRTAATVLGIPPYLTANWFSEPQEGAA